MVTINEKRTWRWQSVSSFSDSDDDDDDDDEEDSSWRSATDEHRAKDDNNNNSRSNNNSKDAKQDWKLQIYHYEKGKVDRYWVHQTIIAQGPRRSDYLATLLGSVVVVVDQW
jgi:hypothetical protein